MFGARLLIIDIFFFAQSSVNGIVYFDMLIFQQYEAPHHCTNVIHDFLDDKFAHSWIGKDE